MQPEWKHCDPGWLLSLAEQQQPDQPWLAAALRDCTRCIEESPAYLRFVSGERANQAGAEWQFEGNLSLHHPQHGELILDILQGQRVGGVEFLDRL